MLGSGVSTIRDLLALAEPGWSPPLRPGGARVPEGSLFAAGCAPRRPAALQKRKRSTGAPSSTTTGVPSCCNPETSVGLMAAVAEPASARLLRVAQPARAAGASGIVAALTAGLNDCNGTNGGRRVPLCVDGSLLACELCSRRLDDRTIYIYMDKWFCQPECRYEYFLEELHEQRRKLAAEARASKRAWRRHRDGKAADLHTEAADRSSRRIFLAPDDERGGDDDNDDTRSFP